MKEKLSHQARKDIFEQCGVEWGKRKTTHNVHHDYFRCDLKRHLIPSNFNIKDKNNLTVLPRQTHEKLHWIVENDIQYRDIRLRKYMSNMAFNGDLDLIPQNIYYSKLMASH